VSSSQDNLTLITYYVLDLVGIKPKNNRKNNRLRKCNLSSITPKNPRNPKNPKKPKGLKSARASFILYPFLAAKMMRIPAGPPNFLSEYYF